ncbi:MAG TPA: hypothetical protein VNS88_16915 [Nitrospiraceae bacterium]|nr:hypothetical protein [Nitrospiraceae bacterium]
MTDKITETGCYLDNHRGIYMIRDTILFAKDFGFIIDPFAQFAVDMYEDHDGDQEYPFESLVELSDEAVAWLNSGQTECNDCGGRGQAPVGSDNYFTRKGDKDGVRFCKTCSGTGRGDRIAGQNFPPRIPEGTHWANEDGDFGLWYYDDDGNVIDTPDAA